MATFNPGDVLSFSAGSSHTGPEGYRKLRKGADMFEPLRTRWPDLFTRITWRTPLLINAYPGVLGTFSVGVYVDTYLNPKTVSRALQLACVEAMPAVVLSQPVIVADMLFRHVAGGFPFPRTLVILTGGYVMPRSLEAALRRLVVDSGCEACDILHAYGAAEVEAGCLLAMERTEAGELVYYPRKTGVEVELDGEEILLSFSSPEGEKLVDRFRTGDSGRPDGEGFVLWNHSRLHPAVLEVLESWDANDWRRRTGILHHEGDRWQYQLREGYAPEAPEELGFFDFAKEHGFSWLDKPNWR